MQKILDLCHFYCVEWDILLNAKNTMNMACGKGTKPSFLTSINNVSIPWVEKWKYLGVTLKSGARFDCCVKEKVASFYCSINSILRIEGQSDKLVNLQKELSEIELVTQNNTHIPKSITLYACNSD